MHLIIVELWQTTKLFWLTWLCLPQHFFSTTQQQEMSAKNQSIRFWIGHMFREAGESLDKVGCWLQGSLAYQEKCKKIQFKFINTTLFYTVNRHRRLMNFKTAQPNVTKQVFVAPSAHVIGNVFVGESSSIWYNAVLRGDVNKIFVGANSNIQDRVIVHVASKDEKYATSIGNNVTVGTFIFYWQLIFFCKETGAVLHACTLKNDTYVGVGAIILDGAVVESNSMVAAGSVVTAGTVIPSGQLWAGTPAKFVRDLSKEEQESIAAMAKETSALAQVHREENDKHLEELLREIETTEYKEDRLTEYRYEPPQTKKE